LPWLKVEILVFYAIRNFYFVLFLLVGVWNSSRSSK
jgi:hypothetical protein